MFSGPRGTGKTSTAKIFAKALNCERGPTPDPCNHCPNCERITAGTSMDVFEIDAASNRGIDEIRDLRETVKFAPVDGRYKVYIIDEVHMLTTEAFNALLKTLEEPPAHVVFILATTEPHKIPATIHSRCQRYDFRRISVKEIEERLTEIAAKTKLDISAEAIRLIAVQADGGMRDALSILDQCSALAEGSIDAEAVGKLLGMVGHEWVWRLTDALAQRDTTTVLLSIDELISLGKDVRQVLLELAQHFRSLMVYKAAPDIENVALYSEDREVLAKQSAVFTHAELGAIIQKLHDAINDAKWAPEPRIAAEMALLFICRRAAEQDITALLDRVAALEARLAGHEPAAKPAVRQQAAPAPVSPAVSQAPKQEEKKPAVSPKVLSQEPGEIWEAVLKEVLSSGKRSVHACVAQGKLVSIDNGSATVQFVSDFPKERTEKDDYRAIIEKILEQVTGAPLKLRCISGAGGATAAKPSTPQRAEQQPANPEEHPALAKALQMFGGKVIKQDTK